MTTSWNFTNFPTAIDTFSPSLVNGVDFVIANHPNTLASAVVAIQGKLGRTGYPITGLGGVSFDAAGKSSNPGSTGIPTIWVDNSDGPGLVLKYTDDQGTSYVLASPNLASIQYSFDISSASIDDPTIDLKGYYLSISDVTNAPDDFETIQFHDISSFGNHTYTDDSYNTVIYSGHYYRNNTGTLTKHKVSDSSLVRSVIVTPSLGGIAAAAEKIFIASDADNTVYVYDAFTLADLYDFPYAGGGSGITADSTHVFVSVGTTGNHGFEVYTHAGALAGSATRSTADNVGGQIAVDSTYVYLCNSTLGIVEQYVKSSYTYSTFISVSNISGVATLGDGTLLASNSMDSSVYKYSDSLSLITTYSIVTPGDISYTGTHLCVCTSGSYVVTAYNLPGLNRRVKNTLTKINGNVIEMQDSGMTYPVYPSDIIHNRKDIDSILQIGSVTSFNGRSGVVLPIDGDYTADKIRTDAVNDSAYDSVQDWMNAIQGSGLVDGGLVTVSATVGAVDVSSGNIVCKESSSALATTGFAHFDSTADIVLTDLSVNYIYADYNSGTPIVGVSTDSSLLLDNSVVVLDIGYRDGTTVRLINYDSGFIDFSTNLSRRFRDTSIGNFSSIVDWSYGAKIASSGTRNISLTAGVFYSGLSRKSSSAFDTSSSDVFTYYYRDGSTGYTEVVDQTQIDNLKYDDDSGTLATLSGNNFGVHWVYLCLCGSYLSTVYGRGSYTLEEAQQAEPPDDLPVNLSDFSIRVGKIIIGKSLDTMIVQSPFGDRISSSVIPVHNGSSGLQGGSASLNEFYHVTSAEVTSLSKVETALVAMKGPTGFSIPANQSDLQIHGDSLARTVSLVGTDIVAWENAVVVPTLINGWTSAAIPAAPTTAVSWYFFYNNGTFYVQDNLWSDEVLFIARMRYGASGVYWYTSRETHGTMDPQSHTSWHLTYGTYRTSGSDVSTIVTDSTTAADRRPQTSAGYYNDEDLPHVIPAHTSESDYSLLTLTGATGVSTLTKGSAEIVALTGTQPQYNLYTGGSWGPALVSNNSYMAVFQLANMVANDTESQRSRYLYMPSQIQGTLAQMQAYGFKDINLGDFNPIIEEFVPIQKYIIRYTGGDWSITESTVLSGSRNSLVTQLSGSWLSSVAHDDSLINLGTASSLLGVNPLKRLGVRTVVASGDISETDNKSIIVSDTATATADIVLTVPAGILLLDGLTFSVIVTEATTYKTSISWDTSSWEIGSGITGAVNYKYNFTVLSGSVLTDNIPVLV